MAKISLIAMPPPHPTHAAELLQQQKRIFFLLILLQLYAVLVITTERQPYHDSALSGGQWVQELLQGHPDRIHHELGVHKKVFNMLIQWLRTHGHGHSRYITLHEQLAIFLYMCRTGLSIRHVGERFQRSIETVSRCAIHHSTLAKCSKSSSYFQKMLNIFSTPPFYSDFICLPTNATPIPPEVYFEPRFYPFFDGALGAIDGTQISAAVEGDLGPLMRNRKGGITQNVLAVCTFDLRFLYVLSGIEGSAADSSIFHIAWTTLFPIPQDHYCLADVGFGICDALLVPYYRVRYHLAEWE